MKGKVKEEYNLQNESIKGREEERRINSNGKKDNEKKRNK